MKTLQQIDAEIAQLEQQLAVLHEQRREWVNHLDLNKSCSHVWIEVRPLHAGDSAWRCASCRLETVSRGAPNAS